MHIGARMAIGVGSVGGVIGGGYGLNKLLSNETIKSKLEANKYVLLNKDNKEHEKHWTTILTSYKTTIKAQPTSKFKFSDFDLQEVPPNKGDIAKLKKLCEEILKKRTFEDSKDEENYKKASKWCTIPQKASERLDIDGFKTLDPTIDASKANTDDNEWTEKIKSYLNGGKEKKIADWGEEKTLKNDKAGKEALMKKCKTLQDTETHNEKYETIFEEAKQWCAVPKTK